MVQLQALMNDSPQVRQLNAYQQLADGKTSAEAEKQPEETPTDEAETAELESDDPVDLESFFTAQREAISVLNETHHLEYRMIGGEPSLGIASTWEDVSEIHVTLRQRAVSDEWRELWLVLDRAHRAVLTETAASRIAEREYSKLNFRGSDRRGKGSATEAKQKEKIIAKKDKARTAQLTAHGKLDRAIAREKTAARAFIHRSAAEFSVEVADILSTNMPVLTLDSDVAAVDAGAVRYHTGDILDPIPITWYKPVASYPTVNVHDSATAANVALQPFGANPVVRDPYGQNHQFGVTVPNRPVIGSILRNTPKHGKSRANQAAYNGVLASMGYNMAGEDGDHVLDLGFGGNDIIDNYWPLDSVTNRLAFTGWRSTYYLNYKTGRANLAGHEEVVKAPLNAGNLIGKYVQIVAEEASASPVGNNTSASGSSTAWGAQQTIMDHTGAPVVEG